MATVDHRARPALQHEPTYMDMETPKGLRNSRGENNCFLNSAVQVRPTTVQLSAVSTLSLHLP